jgi:hypothetical protein
VTQYWRKILEFGVFPICSICFPTCYWVRIQWLFIIFPIGSQSSSLLIYVSWMNPNPWHPFRILLAMGRLAWEEKNPMKKKVLSTHTHTHTHIIHPWWHVCGCWFTLALQLRFIQLNTLVPSKWGQVAHSKRRIETKGTSNVPKPHLWVGRESFKVEIVRRTIKGFCTLAKPLIKIRDWCV